MRINQVFAFSLAFMITALYVWDFPQKTDEKSRQVAHYKQSDSSQKKGLGLIKHHVDRKLAQLSGNTAIGNATFSLANEHKNLTLIKSCYEKETCHYPQTDPKSYHFAIGQDLKVHIMKIESYIVKNNIKDKKVSELAREFLEIEDGHVKEAALHLLASQEIDEKSLDSILKNIISFHDPRLIKKAMFELKRYMGHESEIKVHKGLSLALQNGAPFVTQEISLYISLFVNPNSVDIYSQATENMSPSSVAAKKLKVSIEEFIRQESAA